MKEIASIEDELMRAAALPMHEIDRIEDEVLRYAARLERILSRRVGSASSSGHCPGGSVEVETVATGAGDRKSVV